MSLEGATVNDCHAEVITRRCFMRCAWQLAAGFCMVHKCSLMQIPLPSAVAIQQRTRTNHSLPWIERLTESERWHQVSSVYLYCTMRGWGTVFSQVSSWILGRGRHLLNSIFLHMQATLVILILYVFVACTPSLFSIGAMLPWCKGRF
jgi:hypothetical protein